MERNDDHQEYTISLDSLNSAFLDKQLINLGDSSLTMLEALEKSAEYNEAIKT